MSVSGYNLNPFSNKSSSGKGMLGAAVEALANQPPPPPDTTLELPPPPPPVPVTPQKRPQSFGGAGVSGPFQGQGGTIKTGPGGVPSPAVTGQKTLLGQ